MEDPYCRLFLYPFPYNYSILFKRTYKGWEGWSLRDFGSNLYRMLEWVSRFAYLHLLWVLFTLAGAVILGIYPSTAAVFAIMRKWLHGESDLPVFRTFWTYYRKEFWKSNHLGIYITIILFFIFVDLFYIYSMAESTFSWIFVPLLAGILLFSFLLLYIFPVFVQFDHSALKTIRTAFLIMLISPIQIFMLIICLLAIAVIIWFFPAIGFIFGISLYAFVSVWVAGYSFKRLS